MKDLDDIKFESLLADKRHKEILKALKSVAQVIAISGEYEDSDILNAIKEQGVSMQSLVDTIKSIPSPEAPVVNIDQQGIVESIKEITDKIIDSNNKVIEAISGREMPDTFDLIKDRQGFTKKVKINYKKP